MKPIGLVLLAVAIGFGLFARFRQAQTPGTVANSTVMMPTGAAIPVQPEPAPEPALSAPPSTSSPAAVTAATMAKPAASVATSNPSTIASSSSPVAKTSADGVAEESPEGALQRWFSAYSSGDSKAYFKAYAANFVPSNGVSYATWKQQRRNFFAGGNNAKIEMTDVRIETNGAEAQSHFHQSFRSPRYNDDVSKTLSWRLIEGKWLIVAEITQAQVTPSTPVKQLDAANAQAREVSSKPERSLPASRTVGIKSVNPKQQSANLYRDAVVMVQEGHLTDAQAALTQALDANPANHSARQMLADLLVDAGRRREATALLSNGLGLAPGHSGFCMALARLHLAAGAKQEAFAILQQGLSNAGDDGEYHGFFAALLQTFGRHEEATKHYLIGLRSDPSMPTWLVGIGISLRAQKKVVDAAEAFQRALDTGELSTEVADFARQQIDQIRRSR